MTHEEIVYALNTLYPNTAWQLSGDDFDKLVWVDETPKPTKTQIQAEIDNPTPRPEPTIIDKLASVGLSIEELKAALGGN
jgi:hypothetical protein